MDFAEAESRFRQEQIRELSESEDGLRFLKLRSLSRKEYLERLFCEANVATNETNAKALFRLAFESEIPTPLIESVIKEIYEGQRLERRNRENDLVNELYKMEVFDWGGLHQNSLETTIVNNYVKTIWRYDVLEEKIEGDLHNSLRGYVLCSWYNHWTSILIEDVFRDHDKVLPAIGQVKKIDFFINNRPFDLKVTYMPEGWMAECRRQDGLRPELTLLKQCARRVTIPFDAGLRSGKLLEDLWKKHEDHPAEECRQLIGELRDYRQELLTCARQDSSNLIKWLYENQGFRRFDASNRLFLVLVDALDYFNSWKLKRALPLLRDTINDYIDVSGDEPGNEIQFLWEGEKYTAVSDVVFVIKPGG